MTEEVISIVGGASGSRGASAIVPTPRGEPITIRLAEARDLPFLDALQKMHAHQVGWFPAKQMESYVAAKCVVIAEQEGAGRTPLGYCIAKDRYMGHDDVGIIYQLNVTPGRQRHLVGASLIKAVFERCAYGCRLFCCWCAQDIEANYFWEALGFIPLAFRTGSRGKQRVHIFWQRRVREDDATTPYWYPFQTHGGAIREDRLCFPIPPDTHWRDAKPMVLPGAPSAESHEPKALPPARPRPAAVPVARKMAIVRSQSKHLQGLPPGKAAIVTAGGLRYVERADYVPEPEPVRPKRAPRPPAPKNDPKFVAAARELRDRYLEQVNEGRLLSVAKGKYDVSRGLPIDETRTRLLAS